jgi:Tol biopolymer transport system component
MWFCKMNWDGSNKKEICELWPGQNIQVGTESYTMWLDVAPKAKKAAFSIEFGTTPSLGLWVIDLDGKNLHELARPKWTDTDKCVYVHPGVSPDGKEVVFCAAQRQPEKISEARLGIVKVKTGEVRWLTNGPCDGHPDWSPDGDWIVYTHYTYLPNGKKPRNIQLIKPDGSDTKPIMGQLSPFSMDINASKKMFAWWPTFSTDGRWIWALSGNPCFYVADARTAKTVVYRDAQHNVGSAKLGQKGILCTGLAIWLLIAEPPDFKVMKKLTVGPRATVPSEHYSDLSTFDLKWGEPKK